ncbi:hypothetical protein ACLB1N_21955 [Escherichia coli]
MPASLADFFRRLMFSVPLRTRYAPPLRRRFKAAQCLRTDIILVRGTKIVVCGFELPSSCTVIIPACEQQESPPARQTDAVLTILASGVVGWPLMPGYKPAVSPPPPWYCCAPGLFAEWCGFTMAYLRHLQYT